MEKNFKLGQMIKILNTSFEKEYNKKLEDIELTSSQLGILMYIYKHRDEEVYQKDMEKRFKLQNPTVTGLLNRLEAKGFIMRVTSLKDARYKKIIPTEKTLRIGTQMKLHAKEMREKLTKNISKEELKTIETILQKMLNNISEEEKV